MATASRRLRMLALLALLGGARTASAGWAEMAKDLQGEEAECRFILFLCEQANRAREAAAAVPAEGGTELLASKRAAEARLMTQDAVAAARVIARKHPDEPPWCFEDADCEFLREALPAPRRSPPEK